MLRKIRTGKAMGLDHIPVKIWKHLGEKGIEWLKELFNVLLGLQRCLANGDSVQSSCFTRTRVIFRIVIIIEAFNYIIKL